MLRVLRVPVLFALIALLAPLPLLAEEPPAADPADGAGQPQAPALADDAFAAEVVELFKEEYKAKGLTGEDKYLQRDFALSKLAEVQHPEVVKALEKISKSSDETLRTLAVIYLGEQRALPGLAGPPIVKAMKRRSKDPILLISGLQSLGNLQYLGAADEIADLLRHRDFAVKKAAIQSVGEIREMRLWKEILKLAGVEVRTGDDVSAGTEQGGKEEVVEEGYSYEGVEVTYDTGTSGDHDQKMAEKIGKAKLAANKAAAGGGRSGGGGGGGAGGGATARGGVSRNPKELMPFVLKTLFQLTGEQFSTSKEVAKWVIENRQVIQDRIKVLDASEKDQQQQAKDLR